jgi:hypothetical protein
MNDFTPDWLALREPVDHRSRSVRVGVALRDWAQARWARTGRPLRVVDLAAGTGSNCRYLAERLPVPQTWRLLDRDPALLDEAAERLDRTRSPRGGLPATILSVEIEALDLAAVDLAEVGRGADLITCSALLDLVSGGWLAALLTAVGRRRQAFLAALTYDGCMRWAMADPADALVVDLVNRHQRTDKGFGVALGPDAGAVLDARLAEMGATVVAGDSDWVLGPDEAALQARLLPMWAEAAKAVAPAEAAAIDAWRARRNDGVAIIGSLLVVGHRDVFVAW